MIPRTAAELPTADWYDLVAAIGLANGKLCGAVDALEEQDVHLGDIPSRASWLSQCLVELSIRSKEEEAHDAPLQAKYPPF